jgi:hypothetical protein
MGNRPAPHSHRSARNRRVFPLFTQRQHLLNRVGHGMRKPLILATEFPLLARRLNQSPLSFSTCCNAADYTFHGGWSRKKRAVPDGLFIISASCCRSMSCAMHIGAIPYIHRTYTVAIPRQHAPRARNSRSSPHAGADLGVYSGGGRFMGRPGRRPGEGFASQSTD